MSEVATLPNRALSTPAQTMQKLQEIEDHLGLIQNTYEDRTAKHAEARWEHKIEMATARLDQTGTVQERDDKALVAVAKEQSSKFREFVAAESNYLATKVTAENLSERASILQSLLKSQGRA